MREVLFVVPKEKANLIVYCQFRRTSVPIYSAKYYMWHIVASNKIIYCYKLYVLCSVFQYLWLTVNLNCDNFKFVFIYLINVHFI